MAETLSPGTSDPIALPTERRVGCPFDPPAELARLRERQPVQRLAYPGGHTGWLVTSHALIREVLADARFSARPEYRKPAVPRPGVEDLVAGNRLPPGFFILMDPPEHTRYRRLLTGQFTVRRMRRLEPRVAQITAEHLDAMAQAGPPVDLVQAFALSLPSLVICELLGVPYEERERFQRDAAVAVTLDSTAEQVDAAIRSLGGYLRELIGRKREQPTDDLLGGLVADGELTDAELTGVAMLLLVAGHETTANMIGLGVFALLEHPEQTAALRDDPALAERAVEELLRYLSIIQFGAQRGALEDVELGGVLVRAGEVVTLSIPAGNRDPQRYGDPDTLDLAREATGHLAFGHGVHQCIGQQLARIELRAAYPALLRRFPTLRLAVAPAEVQLRTDMNTYGVHRLPVTW